MIPTTDVLAAMLELEDQINQGGWDRGVGIWALHCHEDGELLPMKVGGPGFIQEHPIDVLSKVIPPPACYPGMVVSYECWSSRRDDMAPREDPERLDTRYVIGALRSGTVLAIEHIRDRKPRAFVLDPVRALAMGDTANITTALLHLLVEPEDLVPMSSKSELRELQDLLLALGLIVLIEGEE